MFAGSIAAIVLLVGFALWLDSTDRRDDET
jgi:hypothetical protein